MEGPSVPAQTVQRIISSPTETITMGQLRSQGGRRILILTPSLKEESPAKGALPRQ